jgi:P2-related tail formation protein
MSTLSDATYSDQLTPSLQAEHDFMSIMKAIEPEMKLLISDLPAIKARTSISSTTDILLQYLAMEFRADYFDGTATRYVREQTVLNSMEWNTRLGTPSVLDEILTLYFNVAIVEEWNQYGGQNYHFRIKLQDPLTDTAVVAAATRKVLQLKNVRSQFDGFVRVYSVTPAQRYVASLVVRRRTQTISCIQ